MKNLISKVSIAAILLIAVFTKVNATGLENIKNYAESALIIESWMTDEAIWNNSNALNVNLLLEAESNLELESWMMNTSFTGMTFQLEPEVESELDVEYWMIDSKYWQLNYIETEQRLEIEEWMVNSTIWR